MTASRLTLINDCLLLTGENTFSEPDDGSPEWNVCSAAYDAAVEHLIDEHNWNFAKEIVEIEDRTDPDDPNWTDAYERPDGTLHITKIMDTDGNVITDWKLTGSVILVDADDGILIERMVEPEPALWPGLFLKALRHGVMAGIYRGLKKDAVSARAEEKSVEFYLGKARPRSDLEEPGRTRFVSTLATKRRTRRI